ncbi:hypothetical protein LCGC14_1735380 [marine sediment metagenome]|uniref:Uncharacterized protein n=1 Tax=marine sediment metagenome TaxID=412755 RepID=A0A0F9JNR9_9ZZZZ
MQHRPLHRSFPCFDSLYRAKFRADRNNFVTSGLLPRLLLAAIRGMQGMEQRSEAVCRAVPSHLHPLRLLHPCLFLLTVERHLCAVQVAEAVGLCLTAARHSYRENPPPTPEIVDPGTAPGGTEAVRHAATVWIIKNQFGRRNLTLYQRAELALKLKPLISPGQGARTELRQNSDKVDTKRDVARAAGVSHDTIARAEYLRRYADEPTKAKFRTGQTSIIDERSPVEKAGLHFPFRRSACVA